MKESYAISLLEDHSELPEPGVILERFRSLVVDGPESVVLTVATHAAPAAEITEDQIEADNTFEQVEIVSTSEQLDTVELDPAEVGLDSSMTDPEAEAVDLAESHFEDHPEGDSGEPGAELEEDDSPPLPDDGTEDATQMYDAVTDAQLSGFEGEGEDLLDGVGPAQPGAAGYDPTKHDTVLQMPQFDADGKPILDI